MVLVVGVCYVFFIRDKSSRVKNPEQCQQVLTEVGRLDDGTDPKDAKDAYNKLAPNSDFCAKIEEPKADKPSFLSTDHVQPILYNAELARAAYISGNKAQAKVAAQKVIEKNKSLTPEQREAIPNRDALFIDMYLIVDDLYTTEEEGQ